MILVVLDHDLGQLDAASLQAVTAARGLDPDVHVLLVGEAAREHSGAAAAHGAAVVHVALGPDLTDYAPLASARAVVELVGSLAPRAVLATGTSRGNEVLAHVAAILDLPFAADCVEITIGDAGHEVVRNRWGGNLLESARVHAKLLLASVSPNSVRAVPSPGAGELREFAPMVSVDDVRVRVVERTGEVAAGVGLADARVVVSGGRGVGGPEGFADIEELAKLLGGAVGCSRVVTSSGWRPHSEQVGQTGTKVAPDLYLAFGISGATQHIAGCRSAKTIVAINTDKEAPIMGFAHYAIVGDLRTILPELVAATQRAKDGS